MKKIAFLSAAALAAIPIWACTTVVAGKSATATGHVILGHNEDDRGNFEVLHGFVPARTFRAGAKMPAEKGRAEIPQVANTLGFYWSEVKGPSGSPSFADVFLNEKGVAVVSNNARGKPQDDPSLLVEGGLAWALRRAVAERAASARDAVDVITNLVSTWGYGAHGRIYTVADKDEAWIVELVYGRRHFAARRVADDEVALIPNAYTIRTPAPGDVLSPDVAAKGAGFDFAREFQREDAWKVPHSQDRWRNMVRIFTGKDWPNDDYPFSVKPSVKVDAALVKKALSTHYEGTPDEVPVGADGTRHDEEKVTPICRRSTVESSVFEFAAEPAGTRLEFATGSPCKVAYREMFPLKSIPSDIDRSADAAMRVETHPLPCVARGGLDLQMLLGLISIPSITPDIAENNRAAEYLKDWFERHGVFTAVRTNEAGRIALYASTTPGKNHDIVFVTHIDVVPPLVDGQFSPVIEGDTLYGRGACDTKGNVAVIAQALANLAGKGSFGAVIATDEEGRSAGTSTPTWLLKEGFTPQKFLIVGDTNGEHTDSLTIAEKGHVCFRLVAHGKGGHSSIPWVSDNPLPKLNEGYAKILAAFPKPAADEDHWRDYLTATQLFGSQAGNIIPDTAEMTFSYRFIEPDGPQKLKAFIEKLTGLEVVMPAKWRPPVISDPSNPYISSLFEAMRKKWPDRNIRYTKMSCATDATRYIHLKLPTVIFGANGKGAHAQDERVSVRSLFEYAEMFTGYLKRQVK